MAETKKPYLWIIEVSNKNFSKEFEIISCSMRRAVYRALKKWCSTGNFIHDGETLAIKVKKGREVKYKRK